MGKRIMALGLAIMMIFLLSGCTKLEMTETITKKGEYSGSVTQYIEKQAIVDYVGRKMGSDYMKEVEKSLKDEGWTFQTIDGVEYYVSKPAKEKHSSLAKLYKKNQKEALDGKWQVWETGMHMDMKAMMGSRTWLDAMLGSDGDMLEPEDLKELQKNLENSYFTYSIIFDYNIEKVGNGGVIDSANPKKATWKIPMSGKLPMLDAVCHSDISVRGVVQGTTYRTARKVVFEGASSAVCKGKKIKSGTVFKEHGQHTLILKAKSGERRTVSFFIDRKKPIIKGVENHKTYKKRKFFQVIDKDSGVASVRINGKKCYDSDYSDNPWYEASKKGVNKVVVRDNVGNVTRIRFKLALPKKKK